MLKLHQCFPWWIQNSLINMHDHFWVKRTALWKDGVWKSVCLNDFFVWSALTLLGIHNKALLQCCGGIYCCAWAQIVVNKWCEVFKLHCFYEARCLQWLRCYLMREMKSCCSWQWNQQVVNNMTTILINYACNCVRKMSPLSPLQGRRKRQLLLVE